MTHWRNSMKTSEIDTTVFDDISFMKISQMRECDYVQTPELTKLVQDASSLKKGLYDFFCSMKILMHLCKGGYIDQEHDGNRGHVWDVKRAISFLVSFSKNTNSYTPVFSLEFHNGKPVLLVWDANNRTYSLREFFDGCKALQKLNIKLPEKFYGKLFIKTPRKECKEFFANINNTEAQTAGEIFSSAHGEIIDDIKNYINSSTGIYCKKGRSYRYLENFPNTRKKHVEVETKNVLFFSDKSTKGTDNLETNKFSIRQRLIDEDISDLDFIIRKHYKTMTDAMDIIHKTDDSYRIDYVHKRWLGLLYTEINDLGEFLIKDDVKFLLSVVQDLRQIQKISETDDNDQKRILKTELSHQLNGSRFSVFKHMFRKMRKNPRKYGLIYNPRKIQ